MSDDSDDEDAEDADEEEKLEKGREDADAMAERWKVTAGRWYRDILYIVIGGRGTGDGTNL